jgi:hypothetical protein
MYFGGTIESKQSVTNNQTAAYSLHPYIRDITPIKIIQETLSEPESEMPAGL